jgi:hypothetical protein
VFSFGEKNDELYQLAVFLWNCTYYPKPSNSISSVLLIVGSVIGIFALGINCCDVQYEILVTVSLEHMNMQE